MKRSSFSQLAHKARDISPILRTPLLAETHRIPYGNKDDEVPAELSQSYAARVRSAGDDVKTISL